MTTNRYRNSHHVSKSAKSSVPTRMARSSCRRCGCKATAAVIGTMCKNRITSPTNGFGASCRKYTSMYVHITCETSHIERPRPIRAQKRRGFGEEVRTFARHARAAANRTRFCRMSPKAVSAKLRGTKTDTTTWTHTKAPIPRAHFLPFLSADFPTPRIVSFASNLLRITGVTNDAGDERGGEAVTKGSLRSAPRSGKRLGMSYIAAPRRRGTYRVRASLQ